MARYITIICILMLSLMTCQALGPVDPVSGSPTRPPEVLGNSQRNITIPYTDVGISLDGHIEPGEWQTFRTGWYFDAFDGRSFHEYYGEDEEFSDQNDISVTFYALYDDTYLYFGANISDDNIVVDSGSTFWRDDGFELMIDGAHDMDLDQRADDPWPGFEDGSTFLINADNLWHHDYSNGTPYERSFSCDGDWLAYARMVPQENYYVVEMVVRLDSIADPAPNSTLGLNVGVNDDDTGGETKTALKWTGEINGTGGFPAFKNETMWGSAFLQTYVEALLPNDIKVDEDREFSISGNHTLGNHPDLFVEGNFTWTLPIYGEAGWNNITKYGLETAWSFEDPGQYHILLEVADPGGIRDTTSACITVEDSTPPILSAGEIVAMEDVPVLIAPAIEEEGWVDHVNWSFIDMDVEDILFGRSYIYHTFEDPGSYQVRADVVDGSGNSANITINITILDNTSPEVIEIADMEAALGSVVVLDATGCLDDNPQHPEPEWINYTWNLRGIEIDGAHVVNDTLQGMVVEVLLDIPGVYACDLLIEDGAGLTNSTSFNISIMDLTRPEPVMGLPDTKEMWVNVVYNFTSYGSQDDDPLIMERGTFLWNFTHLDPYEQVMGGESVGSWEILNNTAYFSFPNSGYWLISLMVADCSGNHDTAGIIIYVKDDIYPVVALDIPDTIDEDTSYFLDCRNTTDNNRVDAILYEIRAGGEAGDLALSGSLSVISLTPGQYVDQEELHFKISDPGQYTIILFARDNDGLGSSISRSIIVMDITPPTPAFNLTSGTLKAGETIYLSGSSSWDNVGISSFQWSVNGTDIAYQGGGEFIWEEIPVGEFVITLIVLDEAGNAGEAYFHLTVEPLDEQSSPEDGTSSAVLYMWLAAFGAMFALLLIAVLFVRAKRKRGTGDQAGPESAPEE